MVHKCTCKKYWRSAVCGLCVDCTRFNANIVCVCVCVCVCAGVQVIAGSESLAAELYSAEDFEEFRSGNLVRIAVSYARVSECVYVVIFMIVHYWFVIN